MPEGQLILIFYAIAFIAIYYFLLYRPQQKRAREKRMLLESLKVNDEVVTIGGLHGKVKDVREDIIILQVDENVRIKVDKGAIGEKLSKEAKTSPSKR